MAARPLCMRKVRGSTPRISRQYSNGHVFDSRWVLNIGTYSSEVERSIADIFYYSSFWPYVLAQLLCVIGRL